MILFWWFGSFDGLRTSGIFLVRANGVTLVCRPSANQHDPFALSLSKGVHPAVVWVLRRAQDERDFCQRERGSVLLCPSANQHDPFALSLSKGVQPAVVWVLRRAQDERDFLVRANLICAGSFDRLRTNGGWVVHRPSASQYDPFALSLSKGSTCGGFLGPSPGSGRTGVGWCVVHRQIADVGATQVQHKGLGRRRFTTVPGDPVPILVLGAKRD